MRYTCDPRAGTITFDRTSLLEFQRRLQMTKEQCDAADALENAERIRDSWERRHPRGPAYVPAGPWSR